MAEHSWRRTITKAITYRAMSFTLATFGLGYFFHIAFNVSILYNLVMALASFGLFIVNEVAWRHTSFGKPKE